MLTKLLTAVGAYVVLKDHLIPLVIILVDGIDSGLEKNSSKLCDMSKQVGEYFRKSKK